MKPITMSTMSSDLSRERNDAHEERNPLDTATTTSAAATTTATSKKHPKKEPVNPAGPPTTTPTSPISKTNSSATSKTKSKKKKAPKGRNKPNQKPGDMHFPWRISYPPGSEGGAEDLETQIFWKPIAPGEATREIKTWEVITTNDMKILLRKSTGVDANDTERYVKSISFDSDSQMWSLNYIVDEDTRSMKIEEAPRRTCLQSFTITDDSDNFCQYVIVAHNDKQDKHLVLQKENQFEMKSKYQNRTEELQRWVSESKTIFGLSSVVMMVLTKGITEGICQTYKNEAIPTSCQAPTTCDIYEQQLALATVHFRCLQWTIIISLILGMTIFLVALFYKVYKTTTSADPIDDVEQARKGNHVQESNKFICQDWSLVHLSMGISHMGFQVHTINKIVTTFTDSYDPAKKSLNENNIDILRRFQLAYLIISIIFGILPFIVLFVQVGYKLMSYFFRRHQFG